MLGAVHGCSPVGLIRALIFTVVAFLAAAAPGAVCTDSPNALNRMSNAASNGANTTVQGGDFAIFAWIRPSDLTASESGYFEMAGGLQIHVLGGAVPGVRARLLSSASPTLEAVAQSNLQPNEWALLAMSYDSAAGSVDVWVISESQALAHGSAIAPGFVIGPDIGNAAIGSFGGAQAMLGKYGITALRGHTIIEQDVLDVWDSRLHYAPYNLNNLGGGGSMNGADGCNYMFNHAVTTAPINHAAGAPHDIAAVVGKPSNRWNFHIFDRFGSGSGSLRVVRQLTVAQGFINCTPYDPPGDGFFIRPLSTFANPLPEPHYVSGEAPLLRQLATGPEGLLRVMTSANSRAVLASDGSASGTSNYAHGFIALNLDKTAGILNASARIGNNAPWFGFDTAEHAPYMDGNITEIRLHNFSRFWTGSHHGNSHGPGGGVHLAAGEGGATYIMRCRPQGMIEADQPLVMEAYLLRFPGASDITWVPNLHWRQGEPGSDAERPTTMSLDTQEWSHTLGEGDSVPTAARVILAGNHSENIAINDAVQAGPCISLVKSVTYNAGDDETRVDFEHPFTVMPQMGDVLRFGSWGYEAIQYEWPGVEGDPENVWRGLRISVGEGGGGQGAVVFAFSAWRPDVDGYVFGTAGWSGNGYWRQIDRAFGAAIEPWMEMLAPDVWLQMFAQQGSGPSTINSFKNRIRNALPGIEIAWLGDYEHESGGVSEDWQHYILNNAEENDVIAMTLVLDERIGSYNALLDDGLRSDANHINARGNKRLAEIWTEMLLLAAIDPSTPPKPGDLNGDGSVGVADLLILLANWGPCDDCEDCPADLNGDCNVGVADLLMLLGNWG